VWSDGLDSRGTTDSQLEHRDVSAHQRRIQQQQQQQQMLVSDSKTSSGDRRSAAVQRLVDLQHQSKHLSRLLAAKREVNKPTVPLLACRARCSDPRAAADILCRHVISVTS